MSHPYRTASDRSDVSDPRYRVTRWQRRLVIIARWLRLAWYWERKTEQHRLRTRRRLERLFDTPIIHEMNIPEISLAIPGMIALTPDGHQAIVTNVSKYNVMPKRPPKTPPRPLPPPKKISE